MSACTKKRQQQQQDIAKNTDFVSFCWTTVCRRHTDTWRWYCNPATQKTWELVGPHVCFRVALTARTCEGSAFARLLSQSCFVKRNIWLGERGRGGGGCLINRTSSTPSITHYLFIWMLALKTNQKLDAFIVLLLTFHTSNCVRSL